MPVTKTCPVCGRTFTRDATWAGKVQTCSYECGGRIRQRPVVERFWPKVDKNGPVVRPELGACWVWTGRRQQGGFGYGTLRLDSKGAVGLTHRISWELHNNPLPKGAHVLHRCDNPPCVNPAHLFLGDQRSNTADRDAKDRVRHGSTHRAAKLNETAVRQVRTLYATGNISLRRLAAAFGVSSRSIADIINRRTWRRVE